MNWKRIVLILILPLLPFFSFFEHCGEIFYRLRRQIKDDWETWKDAWDSNA